MAETIFKKGDKVILGRHTKIDPSDSYSDSWDTEMDRYVGQTATITNADCGKDDYWCKVYIVDLDGGACYWRGNVMKAVGAKVKQLPRDDKNCPKCRRCRQPAPWADPDPEFICWACSH